jgi:hypothetical protein
MNGNSSSKNGGGNLVASKGRDTGLDAARPWRKIDYAKTIINTGVGGLADCDEEKADEGASGRAVVEGAGAEQLRTGGRENTEARDKVGAVDGDSTALTMLPKQ